MPRQLSTPAPFRFVILRSIQPLHPLPNLALHRPDPAAPFSLLRINVRPNDIRHPFHPPLRPYILIPPYRLHGAPASASLHLLRVRRMAGTRGEQVADFGHPDIGREGGEVGRVDAGVGGRVVVFVGGERGPHAAVDAEAGAGEV